MKNLTLNDRIKKARNAIGKTMAELSSLFNIPERTISNYERGISSPSVEYLNLLHTNFGINLDWLITGNGEMLSINDTNLVKIPERGEVECAAGHGCYVFDENITNYISFDAALLKQLGANISACNILKVKGDSMYPTLQTGDKVLVDTSQKEIIDGKIYIIRIEDKIKIKRLHKLTRGRLEVISDNKEYSSDILEPDKDDFEVCGRALWNIMFI